MAHATMRARAERVPKLASTNHLTARAGGLPCTMSAASGCALPPAFSPQSPAVADVSTLLYACHVPRATNSTAMPLLPCVWYLRRPFCLAAISTVVGNYQSRVFVGRIGEGNAIAEKFSGICTVAVTGGIRRVWRVKPASATPLTSR